VKIEKKDKPVTKKDLFINEMPKRIIAMEEAGESKKISSNSQILNKTGITRRKFIGIGVMSAGLAFLARFLPPFVGEVHADWDQPCYPNCSQQPFSCVGCWDVGWYSMGEVFICWCGWWGPGFRKGNCYMFLAHYVDPPGYYEFRYCKIDADCVTWCDGYWCQGTFNVC